MISLEILRKRRKSEKIKRHRLLLLISIVLCVNGLSAKNQWYKYFHLGELPEFNKSTLEVLRQPLEDRKITISRAKYTVEYPSSFMFVASMNPCPCGYYGDPTHHCVCTPGQIQRYMNKISGPLLDRIDIHCEVTVVPFKELSQMQPGEPSAVIRERVIKVSEDYCRDILKNQVGLFVIMSNTSGTIYRMEIQQLKIDLANVSSCWVSEERMRIIADYMQKYPSLRNEIFEMLRNEGYNQLGYYFSQLPIDRMQANGYRMANMDKEIAIRNQTQDIGSIVASAFVKGQVYSKQEVKETLQDIYDRLGLKKTAKATDLSNYIPCASTKKDGLKAIRVI